jgi:hypothetical protein
MLSQEKKWHEQHDTPMEQQFVVKQSLPSEGRDAWLKETAISNELKDTYENPSNIFYHAARTDNPSTLPDEFADWLMASPTPERVRELRERVGDVGVGVIARAVSEKLLGRTETGEYDLENLGSRLELLPEQFREELFGKHHQALRDIASTARVLNMDYSHSGSRKTAQKLVEISVTFGVLVAAGWEAWKRHPWGAALMISVPLLYHVGQYGLARLMTSPRFADWLMKPNHRK